MSFIMRDQRFWDSCQLVHDYTQKHVDRAIERREKGQLDEKAESKYVLVYELAKESSDRSVLCSQLLNTFFAGRDTPAVALTNILFCLARHPETWKKMREQVYGLNPEDLTFERLKSLRYAQHVINEGTHIAPKIFPQQRILTFP